MTEFTKKIRDFGRHVNTAHDEVIKKVILEIYIRIVMKTRYKTGRARGNWLTAVGKMPAGTVPERKIVTPDISSVQAAVSTIKPESTVYIVNNLSYIRYLEDGTDKTSGDHMVASTVNEFRKILGAAIRTV